ncbi:DUF4148 domain-containing protein [Paraburkholderia sp.]|uniref:DUF4148 domain-containing protein n=1 Tax=Paraburkholderia sp. TaxID=1926495 RepID=UPI002D5420B8|nr:DUF4148 domain-containing protein [Paraburkholderia sp.]HZZ04716.1 DUF4148 domain-containing protein [Paraburkholderia sp.]
MVSEPRKIVLTSFFVGAVAIAAYISQSNKSWLSADELGLERDNASTHSTRGDTMTGSVSSGPVVARSDSATAIAGDLQAARNSLQRNDLVSAQAQLDAARSAHWNDDQVLALQREVAERAEQAQHVPVATHVEGPARQGGKSARLSSLSSGKTARSHERAAVTREHSSRASSSDAKTQHARETVVAAVGTGSTSSGTALGGGAPVVASAASSGPAALKVVPNGASAPAESQPAQQTPPISAPPDRQADLTAQAVPAQSLPQLAPSAGTVLKSEGGPKTRAQVRAEIARARADGSLPAFGNPDPAGPGGAPSLTRAHRL